MPRYIAKLTHKDLDYYMEWSTVVDAPVTPGMTLDDFKQYYRQEYGTQGFKSLAERLETVEEKGVSAAFYDSVDDLVAYNRAGKNEKRLSKKQIIEQYCLTPNP